MKYAPFFERLTAVAGAPSGRRFAIGGRRDVDGLHASHLHLFAAGKVGHSAALALPASVGALAFAASDLLVVGGGQGGPKAGGLWAIDAGEAEPRIVFEGEGPGGGITALALDRQGDKLAVVTDSGRVGVYALEIRDGSPRLVLEATRALSPRPLRCVAFDPRASRLVTGGDDGVVRVVGLDDLEHGSVHEISTGEGGVGAIALIDDGRVVAGCGDGSLRISYLDGAPDEENRSKDAGHERAVRSLIVGPSLRDEAGREIPRRLFSIGADGVLKSWPLDSRRKPRSIELGSAALESMAWVPASARAKAERRGGTLVVVNDARALAVLTLDETSTASEDVVRVRGELAERAEQLRASSTKVRDAAVSALSEVPEDDARLLIERALGKDDKAAVRKAAAEVLGLSSRRRSRPALRNALSDGDKGVRSAAYEALLLIDGDDPMPTLRAAIAGRHANLRIRALRALPPLRARSALVPGLIAGRLTDGEAKVRGAAFEALVSIEPKGSVVPSRTALARGPADLRASAVFWLGRTQASETPQGEALVEDALDDDDAAVRRMAFCVAVSARVVLGRTLYGLDAELRQAIDAAHKNGPLLLAAPRGAKPSEDDKAPLFAALNCRHPDTALRGARALASLQDPRSTGALLQLSREPDAGLRRAVVAALRIAAEAMPGDTRLVTRLQWLLDDGDVGVRTDAFDALSFLAKPNGDVGALKMAAVAMHSGQADVRARALAIVVQFGPKASATNHAQADRLLSDALDDEAAEVRNTAYKTLWAWNGDTPQPMLERASGSRHADTRQKVVAELERHGKDWATAALLTMVPDGNADVGKAAYRALTESKKNKARTKAQRANAQVHLAALMSPRGTVRAAGAQGARHARDEGVDVLVKRLIALLDDEIIEVHEAAIESLSALRPRDTEPFDIAYGSKFWTLRVRAGELHGKKRNKAAVGPMSALLAIPEGDRNRPPDALRRRAASALADVANTEAFPAYMTLLDDADPMVREMGGRGLAASVEPGLERTLVTVLSHDDLAVRSWIAEGLARLGDVRAVPVLAGTLAHDHKPIRLGAILSFVALGADGLRGVLQGLEDADREVQDLVFAIVVARDVALARAGLGPDLLTAALAASSPELRFAAARALEQRDGGEELGPWLEELVGPRKPDRASALEKWPAEDERRAVLNVLIGALASDEPSTRYAAARVLSLRPQPLSFWREAARLRGPRAGGVGDGPATAPEGEASQPRKRGWIHRITTSLGGGRPSQSLTKRVIDVIRFAGGPSPRAVPPEVHGDEDVQGLVFGTYVGLVRQAPAPGASDETHRVRRDALARLGVLAEAPSVGRAAVLPALRRALSDPHHLVRKAAANTLRTLYPKGDTTPASLALQAAHADVGRSAVDTLIQRALEGDEAARALALRAVDAVNKDVRAHAVSQLGRLFESESLEPWLVALGSRHADVRLSVVSRLVDAQDARVDDALALAVESDHEDLRERAANALASRGDPRALDVLAGFLRHDEARAVAKATRGIVTLVRAREVEATAAKAAAVLAARLQDDPDQTADVPTLIDAIGRVAHPDGAAPLLRIVGEDDQARSKRAFWALLALARHRSEPPRTLPDGRTRRRFEDTLALEYIAVAATHADPELRVEAIKALRDVDDTQAEAQLARLLDDRDETVRVAAAEAVSFRAEAVPGAGLDALAAALRRGRRDLVLPAAAGMAKQRRPEALQPLLLVLEAGEAAERERALVSLGHLADPRCLPRVERLLEPDGTDGIDGIDEMSDEDRALGPAAVEALGRMLPHLEEQDVQGRIRSRVETAAAEGASQTRARALTGLRWAADDRSRGLVENALSDTFEDAGLRRHAAGLLGELGHVDSEAVLGEAVDDSDHGIRRAASKALDAVFPDDPTRVNMLRLRSQHDDIAKPAAGFLARHGDPESLLGRLPSIDSGSVRTRLRRGLIRRGALPVGAIERLLAHEAAGPREDGAWLAGTSCDASLAGPTVAAARLCASQWASRRARGSGADDARKDDDAEQRRAWRASLWAAGRCGAESDAGKDALGTLGTETLAMEGVPAEVQAEALRLLVMARASAELPRVRERLTHADAHVRRVAARATLVLDRSAAAASVMQTQSADAQVHAILAEAVIEQDAASALKSDQARVAVLPRVLGGGSAGVAQDALHDTVRAGKGTARLGAIAALGRVGDARAVQTLQGVLDDKPSDESLRKATYRALRRAQRLVQRAADAQSTQQESS